MTIEPEPSWKPTGRRPPLEADVDLSRVGIYAGDMPSAPRNMPRDYPRGWTAQQPWLHPEFPPPPLRCTLCAQAHEPGRCTVRYVLLSLDAASRP